MFKGVNEVKHNHRSIYHMSELHEKIDELIKKYEGNEYIMNRLRTFIINQLPTSLCSAHVAHEERNKRKYQLSVSGDKFIEQFLAVNKYFYCSKQELFFKYDDVNFKQVSEDDIQHQVLTMITKKSELQSWKHKLKNSLIRALKDRSLLSSIPSGVTIQEVTGKLVPKIMITKNAARHFLVAIGDAIHGNKDKTYIVPSALKHLLRGIENTYYNCFGISNILSNFKLKYHGHDYSDTRFFHCNMETHNVFDNSNMLDLICVASHLSHRYNDADNYVDRTSDDILCKNVFFSKKLTTETLVENFKNIALHPFSGAVVKNKNMIFILKKYFDENNVPNIIFNDIFSREMRKLVQYDEIRDSYIGITSSYLPVVAAFCLFWDEHMKEDYNAPELEIGEVISLFHNSQPSFKTTTGVSSEFIVDLLKYHVSSELSIEQEKYIHNISCDLWDKRLDVEMFFIHIKQQDYMPSTSLHAYSAYTEWKSCELHMSIRCFEKIANELLGEKISSNGDIRWDDVCVQN